MDITEYTKEARRTCDLRDQRDRLTLSALGIAGESGEVVDILKKVLYHDHDLDISSLCKEIGDLLWYMVMLCDTLDITLEDVMKMNVEKLRKRYPEGFDKERSRARVE